MAPRIIRTYAVSNAILWIPKKVALLRIKASTSEILPEGLFPQVEES